jgi:hypothetical protein
MKSECPVSKTGLSDFYSFKQGLSVPVRFVWQQRQLILC